MGLAPLLQLILRGNELTVFLDGLKRSEVPLEDVLMIRKSTNEDLVLLQRIEEQVASGPLKKSSLWNSLKRSKKFSTMVKDQAEDLKYYCALTYHLAKVLRRDDVLIRNPSTLKQLKVQLKDLKRHQEPVQLSSEDDAQSPDAGDAVQLRRKPSKAQQKWIDKLAPYAPETLREFDIVLHAADVLECGNHVEFIRSARDSLACKLKPEQLAEYAFIRTLDATPIDYHCPLYREGVEQLARSHPNILDALLCFTRAFLFAGRVEPALDIITGIKASAGIKTQVGRSTPSKQGAIVVGEFIPSSRASTSPTVLVRKVGVGRHSVDTAPSSITWYDVPPSRVKSLPSTPKNDRLPPIPRPQPLTNPVPSSDAVPHSSEAHCQCYTAKVGVGRHSVGTAPSSATWPATWYDVPPSRVKPVPSTAKNDPLSSVPQPSSDPVPLSDANSVTLSSWVPPSDEIDAKHTTPGEAYYQPYTPKVLLAKPKQRSNTGNA